jgi:hypothetical protein
VPAPGMAGARPGRAYRSWSLHLRFLCRASPDARAALAETPGRAEPGALEPLPRWRLHRARLRVRGPRAPACVEAASSSGGRSSASVRDCPGAVSCGPCDVSSYAARSGGAGS